MKSRTSTTRSAGASWPQPGELPDEAAGIEASGLFEQMTVRQFDGEISYSAEEHIQLLDTSRVTLLWTRGNVTSCTARSGSGWPSGLTGACVGIGERSCTSRGGVPLTCHQARRRTVNHGHRRPAARPGPDVAASAGVTGRGERWNHNIHHYRLGTALTHRVATTAHLRRDTGPRPPRAARRVLPAPSAVALLPDLGQTGPSYAAGPGRGCSQRCSQEPGHWRTLAHGFVPDHQEPNVHAGRHRELVNGRSRIRTTVAV